MKGLRDKKILDKKKAPSDRALFIAPFSNGENICHLAPSSAHVFKLKVVW